MAAATVAEEAFLTKQLHVTHNADPENANFEGFCTHGSATLKGRNKQSNVDQDSDRAAWMTSQNRNLCTSSHAQQIKTAVFKRVIQIAAMHQSTSKNIKTEKK